MKMYQLKSLILAKMIYIIVRGEGKIAPIVMK